ncbi:Colicin I receptor [Halioglobus japonicus]|nr:Colicin I receptor [Halioglobus japonicus]
MSLPVLFATSYLAFAVSAQDLSPQTNAPGKLEEVIVTAEKRSTSVQNTPIAVTAFTGAELERALISKPMDLQFNVPNMLMSKDNFSAASITIRGVGNLAIGSASDSGTGNHFDGVYLNSGRIFEMEFYDAQRIEVLRGPQGTLYGRNTTAGVVNFITRKPEDEFGGNIIVEAGNYDAAKVKGAINIPITDNIAQRFSLFYSNRNGFVKNRYDGNDIDGRDMYSLRSGTRWANDTTDVTLTVNYFHEDDDRMRGSNQSCLRDPQGIIGCLPTALTDDKPNSAATASGFMLQSLVAPITGLTFPADDFINSPRSSDPREQWMDFTPSYKVKDTIVVFEVNHEFGDLTLTSLSGYHDSDFDASNDYDFTVASQLWPVDVTMQRGPAGPITVDRLYNVDRAASSPEQWSQELRVASDYDGDWNFMLGGFYLSFKDNSSYYIYSSAIELTGETLGIPESQRLYENEVRPYQLETYATFGEIYWQARPDIKVTLGARYTSEKKKSEQRTVYLGFLSDPSSANDGYSKFDGDWDEPTGKLNVSWDATDDVMAYVTLSRSYKSGGFNPISAESPLLDPALGGSSDAAEFDPEYINALEVGVKSRLFSDSVQANVTYFYYDYSDLQIGKITNQTSINENYDATIQGFEGEFIWLPDDRWRLTANLAWLDTDMGDGESVDTANINKLGTTEFIQTGPISNIYTGPGCPGGTPTCEGLPYQLQGNKLPNSPELSVNLGVGYSWPLPDGMRLDANTNYYWQDEFYTRIFNAPNDKVDSWEVWNATITLYSADESWFVGLWGMNLNNDDYVTGQALGDQNVGLATNQFLLEPRTYGVSVGYNF